MKHLIYLFILLSVGCEKTDTISSAVKPTEVKIGTQVWNSKNLDGI